ncbi:Methionine-binding lipoprotein MetQ [Peribacillus frigoritolerans]|uniref:MetQ/NlpA family ABC transporter substrate-binding protein n=1 Tax=Peribacillus frigoritolerans TaxID=450367 RepID=UPI000BCA7F4F|nr:MetQ/NlpA family ABC transporter substrate-binding protein [Peribacillus frigoritolerans]MED3711713.1 MetQ/NlpA family ABC transporter substrate-binding protein [Peribacillus frigoritolerans]MED3890686.1 MetQ/NlpA family ABC transporter substrate-binding protein [Peribacillus frigoritolerans]PAW30014.1 methionine ABC transporter substrate-binding protein [Peribacillus simplex]CAH0207384.1 Methionine-binding lipoprotein MetQ [Peribacillus frigoritolerans]
MKKIKWLSVTVLTVVLLVLGACGSNEQTSSESKGDKDEEVTLKIGAASIPHAEILEFIAPDLEKQGVKLDVVISTDGIQTNQQTADKELDANFFQHTPYLEQVNKDSGLNLVNVKGVHIEPFGVYSKKIKSIGELSDGAKVAVPKDPVNFSRSLQLFAANNIIELDASKSGDYTIEDITKNDKRIEFIPVDSPLLVHSLDDVEASAINTNYALEGRLKPLDDALIIEGKDSPYVNILVARPDNKDDKAIQKLANALTTEKVKEFIFDQYEGAVVPAF